MSTPRFRDLRPASQAAVVDSFLGQMSDARFSEKLAGQHLSAFVYPDGRVKYSIKDSETLGSGGYFPSLETALEDFHPPVKSPVTYEFEVLKKTNRPDYIDYQLKKHMTAVEYSGEMTPATARALNDAQDEVEFVVKGGIEKSVSGLGLSEETTEELRSFRDDASVGPISKDRVKKIETILMDIIDDGRIPSSLGGDRIEGLFGRVHDTGFKIPAKKYADIQADQAKFYAVVRSGKSWSTQARFVASAGGPETDKLVNDVLDYIDKMAAGGPGPGFRVFFSPEEARSLQKLSDQLRTGDKKAAARLARTFFARVEDRSAWVSSGLKEALQMTPGKNFSNRMRDDTADYSDNILGLGALQSFIRGHLTTS